MDDRVDARLDAHPVAHRGQRMGQHRQPQAMRLVDGGPQRLEAVLLRARVRPRRVAAARHHDLHAVDIELPALAHPPDDLLGRVGFGAEEPVVAGGRGDRRPGDEQARPDGEALPDGRPDRQRDVVAAARVARGRRPGQQEVAHVPRGSDEHPLDRLGAGDLAIVDRRRVVHVDVGLDEPGQQRDVAQVVDLGCLAGVGRQGGLRPDGFDAAVDHQDGGIGQPAVQRRSATRAARKSRRFAMMSPARVGPRG